MIPRKSCITNDNPKYTVYQYISSIPTQVFLVHYTYTTGNFIQPSMITPHL